MSFRFFVEDLGEAPSSMGTDNRLEFFPDLLGDMSTRGEGSGVTGLCPLLVLVGTTFIFNVRP